MLLKIKAQPVAKLFFAQNERQLLDHAGSFRINDGSVSRLRVLEIGDVLVDRSGAKSGVDGIGRGLDGLIKPLPHIIIRRDRGERLIRHILRKTFLQPEIIEPAHGGEIAKPLMRELVKQENVAIEVIAVRGRAAEEHGFFPEKRSARVLHASIGKAGDQDEVILWKRERLREKFGEIVDALRGNLLHFGGFRLGFAEFGWANVKSGEPGLFVTLADRPRRKRKKIRADRARL